MFVRVGVWLHVTVFECVVVWVWVFGAQKLSFVGHRSFEESSSEEMEKFKTRVGVISKTKRSFNNNRESKLVIIFTRCDDHAQAINDDDENK